MDMNENFALILPRLIDSNNSVDYKKMISILKQIKQNCICIGTGGSQAVSQYAKKVLSAKNKIITVNMEPRDVLYEDALESYKNICAFSYGGDNEGINKALDLAAYYKLNRYAFTSNDSKLQWTLNTKKDSLINYEGHLKREYSFISIASTLIPISLLLRYYLEIEDNKFFDLISDLWLSNNYIKKQDLFESLESWGFKDDDCITENILALDYKKILDDNLAIEIMTGDNTYTASKVLESNMVEAGLAKPIIHEKYSYCHGRSTLAHHHQDKLLVYLLNGLKPKEIDIAILRELKDLFQRVLVLKSSQPDYVMGEFDLAIKAMLLSKQIAEALDKDLSKVDYAPAVKRLYRFRGEM